MTPYAPPVTGKDITSTPSYRVGQVIEAENKDGTWARARIIEITRGHCYVSGCDGTHTVYHLDLLDPFQWGDGEWTPPGTRGLSLWKGGNHE